MIERLIGSAVLAAFVLTAQAPAPSGLVRISVAALDSSGEPVTDLKPDDFQIADQNKPQRIAFFRPNPSTQPTAPLGPHESTNRPGKVLPHSTVILFDLLNQNQTDSLDTWHKLARALPQLESGDSLYLYLLTLEGALSPIHPMGSKGGDDHTWTQQVEKTLDKAMKAASHARPMEMTDTELVVKKTYVALETLANQLATLPGRRDIVWITNGMPNVWNPKTPCNGDWVDCALYVPHLSVTLDKDDVAVNPVSYTSNPMPDVTRDMEQMAGLAGGWLYTGVEINQVLKEVARDAAVSYSISYDPGSDNWDSKFHKIRLTLGRKGIKLRSKQRYYALPDKRPENVKQQAALATVFQRAADDPAIGIRAAIVAEPGKPAQIQIRINPADLLLHEEGGVFTGGLAVLFADIGAGGGPVGAPSVSTLNIHLTREQLDAAMKDGIPAAQEHAIGDAVQKIKILVLDQGSDTAASLTIPVVH
jgi:VWFA-related protein